MVCAEAGRPAHLQDQQKRPVGGDGASQRLRAHREALQEGWLLLQALPPTGAVHLGRQGQSLTTVSHGDSGVECYLFEVSTACA